MIKKLSWTNIFAFFIFIGMGYLFSILSLNNNAHLINHTYPISGGLGLWLAFMTLSSLTKPASSEIYRGHNWFLKLLSALGGLVAFVLFITGIALTLAAAIINAGGAVIVGRIDKVLNIHLILMAYTIIYLFCLWFRCRVKEGTFTLIDNKIFYPEEKFILWPMLNYKTEVIEEHLYLTVKGAKIKCSDIELEADIAATLKFEINHAKQLGLRTLDFSQFIQMARVEIVKSINDRAKNMTVGQLLTAETSFISMKIMGLPFSRAEEVMSVNYSKK